MNTSMIFAGHPAPASGSFADDSPRPWTPSYEWSSGAPHEYETSVPLLSSDEGGPR